MRGIVKAREVAIGASAAVMRPENSMVVQNLKLVAVCCESIEDTNCKYLSIEC